MRTIAVTTQSQPALFDALYHEPLNTLTQLNRLPPIDAPCLCQKPQCLFPLCPHKPDDERNEQCAP